jgi:hypothetical protein
MRRAHGGEREQGAHCPESGRGQAAPKGRQHDREGEQPDEGQNAGGKPSGRRQQRPRVGHAEADLCREQDGQALDQGAQLDHPPAEDALFEEHGAL